MHLIVDPSTLPAQLRGIMETLAEEYPIGWGTSADADEALVVLFRPGAAMGTVEVTREGLTATVVYDQPAQACRGLGALLAGLVAPGETYREETTFRTFGIMLDCSRNAVMTVEHFQQWLRRLALLGYNMAMLYTENTYELPGEEYFGYRRGRYSAAELQAVDDYASRLGIEMIGCIQVLGHLEQLLRWPEYDAVKDTGAVLLVGEEQTYQLIEKMIAHFADVYRSRRIHIGMDETFDLGCGRYLSKYGYKRGFDLFNEHLQRVTGICRQYGLQPMLWSDMYFRMGSKTGSYYDKECVIPDDVKTQIPADAQLVYWDYDHLESDFYVDWISRHRALGFDPIMAGAAATCQVLWYAGPTQTERSVEPCMAACRETGLREYLLTMWGDDGAYCEFDSALAGITHAAECAYTSGPPSRTQVSARFQAICGADYAAVMTAGAINEGVNPVVLLWDDPLLRVAWRNEALHQPECWQDTDAHYTTLLRRLHPFRDTTEPVDLAHAVTLLHFLRRKIRLNMALDAAYAARDVAALAQARKEIRAVVRALDALLASFRRQWHRRNKPFGFETIQIRLGGQRQRYLELAARLEELIAGEVSTLPEFEEQPQTPSVWTHAAWRYLAVSGIA